MARIKSLDRASGAVTVAFCPEKPHNGPALMAAGTVAGAVDSTFSTSSQLELLSVDLSSPGDTLPVVGTVQAPERFHRLAWGHHMADNAAFPPMGLLAGGLADGCICLWDPAAICNARPGTQAPLLARMQKHTGAVRGLEFNPQSPNLLASGAADADLCIWDLAKPSTPSLYPALKGAGGAGGGHETTHMAWNRKVQHILASCAVNGTTVVWDLKRNKPVISFRDPNSQRRASVLAWHPEVATQLVVASDDDRAPTLQMWDLRNSVAPLKEFVGHSKGVMGMAWSQHDPSLLLSCGKDQRNICWDVNSADIVCELFSSPAYSWDIAWAPHSRGVFVTSSFDGRITLNNLHACTGAKVTEQVNPDFTVTHTMTGDATPLKRVPVWMRRPCGATFGFGGKLVSFVNNKVQGVDVNGQPVTRDQGVITLQQVVTEPELVRQSEVFEAALAQSDKSSLQVFCSSKAAAAQQANQSEEAETWSFLGLLFETNGRNELLKKLGFEDVMAQQPQPSMATADANGGAAAGMEALNLDGKHMPNGGAAGVSADNFFDQGDDPDFFDKLPDEGILATSPQARSPAVTPKQSGMKAGSEGGLPGRTSHMGAGSEAGPDSSHELEDDIMRAMIAGNYESAVEQCFKAHRLTDALLIANIFNSDLFRRTMHRYMKMCPKPYMAIIRANVDGDFEGIVRTRPVGQWRETLALLATYTSQEEWMKQCEVLAGRLAASGNHHAALLCHICAGNVDAAVAAWARTCGPSARVDQLQNVIEKSVVMGLATDRSKASGALSDLMASYAALLASQGRLSTALDYLEYAPGEANTSVAVLKDRIVRSGAVQLPPGRPAPPFPFVAEEVKAVAAQQQASQQAGGYYGGGSTTAPATTQHGGAWAASQQPSYGQNAYGYGASGATAAQGWAGQTTAAAAPTHQAKPATPPAYSQSYGSQTSQSTYGQAQYTPTSPAYGAQYGTQYGAQTTQATPTYQQSNVYSAQSAAYGQQAAAAQQSQTYQPTNVFQPAQPQPPAFTPASTTPAAVFNPVSTGAGSQIAAHHQHHTYESTSHQAPPPQGMYMDTQASGGMGGSGGGGAGGVYIPKRPSVPAPAPPVSTPAASVYQATPASQQHAVVQPPPASTSSMYGAAAAAPSFTPTTTAAAVPPAAGLYGQPGMPTAGSGGGMPMQSMAPEKPAAPPAPTGPPTNISVANADTSKVAAEHKSIVTSFNNLYNACMPLAVNPAKKREMEDNSRKLGQLFWRLNQGDVSEAVLPKLHQLCQAIDGGDWQTATHIQVQMTTTDWEECGFWLSAVKRMIKMRGGGA